MQKIIYTALAVLWASHSYAQAVKPANPELTKTMPQNIQKKIFLKQMEQQFDAMDANHDGMLTPEEIQHTAANVPDQLHQASVAPPVGAPPVDTAPGTPVGAPPTPVGIPPVNAPQTQKNR